MKGLSECRVMLTNLKFDILLIGNFLNPKMSEKSLQKLYIILLLDEVNILVLLLKKHFTYISYDPRLCNIVMFIPSTPPLPLRGSLDESQTAELICDIIFMYLKMYLKMYLILRILGLLWNFRLKWPKNQDFWSIFAHNSY